MQNTTAILINRYRLTESSLIVRWCSAEYGIFKTVAKGALRPKSEFSGRLDLYVSCEVSFLPNTKSDLHTLKEVRLAEPRLGLRDAYSRVLAATYFCELVSMVVELETPLPEIYELIQKALDHLAGRDPTPRLLVRFETRLSEILGLGNAEQGGAERLEEAFHHRLPTQRDDLLKEIARIRP